MRKRGRWQAAWIALAIVAVACSVQANPSASFPPRLSALGKAPDWKRLEGYQRTITRADFIRLISEQYAPHGGFWSYATLAPDAVHFFADPTKQQGRFTLWFADERRHSPRPRYFYPESEAGASSLAFSKKNPARPLEGMRICLDPGHIGGNWSRMEERYFRIGNAMPIEEAALTLTTCRHVERGLQALGATVVWTKQQLEPVTQSQPADFRSEALVELFGPPLEEAKKSASKKPAAPFPAIVEGVIHKRQEKLFYRVAEIRARAAVIETLQPDLTLCVHYNAKEWGDPEAPRLVPEDRLVVFVNGAYLPGELRYEDQRFELLLKLLDGTAPLEERAADAIASQMGRTLSRPPELYLNERNSKRVGDNQYVFARNLLANRLFRGPVVFIEGPYMNARGTYAHLQEGDYHGLRKVNGVEQSSLHRQLASAIVEGVRAYVTQLVRPVSQRAP